MRGQATVEYMMLISVLVVAIVAAAYVFVPNFQSGVSGLASDVKVILSGESDLGKDQLECPYTFDPRTGRYHDEGNNYSMVSFAQAEASGC